MDSAGDSVGFRYCCGDVEAVVIEVLAVLGRSPEPLDTAAAAVAGIFPDNSMRLILVFRSSNSSHTDAGAPVESSDSVPSPREKEW